MSLQDAYFGGMIKLVVETESSYFERSTTVGVGLQAQGLLNQYIKGAGGIGVSNTIVDGDFRKSSKESMRCGRWGGRVWDEDAKGGRKKTRVGGRE